MHLNCKVSASINAISEVLLGSVLVRLLIIFYTSELFHVVENQIVGYADGTTIHTSILRPLSRP